MNNWFYMDRMTFQNVLYDELGRNLTYLLLSLDFDSPISFMIGETSEEILRIIQQTFSRRFCRKMICSDHCVICSIDPPIYAKLIWFVQRLLIMSPLTTSFIKRTSLSKEDFVCITEKNSYVNPTIPCDSNKRYTSNINQDKQLIQNTNDNCSINRLIIVSVIIMFMFILIVNYFY